MERCPVCAKDWRMPFTHRACVAQVTRERDNVDGDYRAMQETLTARITVLRNFTECVEAWASIPASTDWTEVRRQARALLTRIGG